MTDTKPTKAIYKCPFCSAEHNLLPSAIRSAEMPVENACVGFVRARAENGNKEDAMVAEYIDALKAYALKMEIEAKTAVALNDSQSRRVYEAETELAALRGRLMEPDEEMIAAGAAYFKSYMTTAHFGGLFKAMTAVALKEGE